MNYKFDFVRHRKLYFTISSIIMILGILSLSIFGLNLGIDFKSGSRIEIHIGSEFVEKDVRDLLKQAEEIAVAKGYSVELHPSSLTVAGDNNEIAVARFDKTIDSDVLPIIKDVFREKYGSQVDLLESKVDPTMSQELAKKAVYALLWASLGIIIYVTIRFEYRFATAAIVALVHDAFLVITVFSLMRLEVDLSFIAAILTIVGYSVNDTIVVFDRIRENLKHAKIKREEDLENVVNMSLNQTLTRSINTVLTVLVMVTALYIFGGSGIKNFSFAILIGLISGAYSSIFLASQIWLTWKIKDLKKKKFNPQTEV